MQNPSNLNPGVALQKILVEVMLPFDLSVMDVVLATAVVVVLLLFISQRHGKLTESDSAKSRRPFFGKNGRTVKVIQEKAFKSPLSSDSLKCAHHFGYLRDHPRGNPIPDECFGCKKVMRCLSTEGSG